MAGTRSVDSGRLVGCVVRVLTLRQPWASLIALGVKSIETRSWSTQYRGPLAIHAGAKRLTGAVVGEWKTFYDRIDAEFIMEHYGTAESFLAPLGAIVATCTLVDVVPIHEWLCDCANRQAVPYLLRAVGGLGSEVLGLYRPDGLAISVTNGTQDEHPWVASLPDPWSHRESEQLPYGDFRCGRYAWLLADVVPVDPPVPFKGGQGLTKTWEPVAASAKAS